MTAVAPVRRGGGFSPMVMLAVILVGVFSFAAFFTLSAFAPELTTGRDGRAHALSTSAVGFAGAVRLSRSRGDDVSIGRQPMDPIRLESLVVLTPERPISIEELDEAAGSATLVVLPKWAVGPHPTHRGWVSRYSQYDDNSLSVLLHEVAPGAVFAQAEGNSAVRLSYRDKTTRTSGRIERLQTISGPNLTPMVTDGSGRTVLARFDREGFLPIYILADPDFLNTLGMGDRNTAQAGLAMLDQMRVENEPIIFDVTLNGLGASRSALRLAFEPPFLGATLGLAIGAALLGWRAAARFGPAAPARRAIALGKAALADNSAALIRLARREQRMGAGYARLIAADLAELISGSRKSDEEAAALLNRLAGLHGVTPNYSQLEAEAANAKTPQQMLEAARKLHAWKEEMTRATR
jgi:hypothetical protein